MRLAIYVNVSLAIVLPILFPAILVYREPQVPTYVRDVEGQHADAAYDASLLPS